MWSADILFGNDMDEVLVLTTPTYRPRKHKSICQFLVTSRLANSPEMDPPERLKKTCPQRQYFYGNKEAKHSKALLNALYSRDCDYLHTLLKDGVNPNLNLMNYETMGVMTALHIAIEMANMEMVEELINSGADLNVVDGDGRSPIDVACKVKDQRFVRLLVDRGCSVENADTRIICLGMAFHHLIHGQTRGDDLRLTIKELLDTGLIRGWNGINDSVAYVNHVYHRDRQIFGYLFQAAHEVRDLGFMVSSQEVMRRRKDQETIDYLVRHGYLETHQKTVSSQAQVDLDTRVCGVSSLQGLCRVEIRRHLRAFPGKISSRIQQLEIPKTLKEYIDFLDLPTNQDTFQYLGKWMKPSVFTPASGHSNCHQTY